MKTPKEYRNSSNHEDVATSIKKDVFFHDLANRLFISPNPESGAMDMCDQDTSMSIILKDAPDQLLLVSHYDACTAEMFKEAYGMSVKDAICKASHLVFSDAYVTYIWCKNQSDYEKFGWLESSNDPPSTPVEPEE